MDDPNKATPRVARGYEGDDISVGRLVAFAGGVAALIIFGALGSTVVFRFFIRHQPLGPPASPFEDVRTLPPEPRLQTEAPQDLNRYRTEQDRMLNSYGWVDPNAGVVRIPVTRAMDILMGKGYPVRSTGQIEGNKQKTPPTAPLAHSGANVPAPAGAKGMP
jgi:hypothetical protein